MRKIDTKSIKILTPSKRRERSEFVKDLKQIQISETYFLSREEWLRFGYAEKTKPLSFTIHLKKYGFLFEVGNYEEGWTIKRIK